MLLRLLTSLGVMMAPGLSFGVDSEPHMKIKVCNPGETLCADVTTESSANRLNTTGIITNFDSDINVFFQHLDISKLLTLGFGASITVPSFPAIKPVGYYKVPTGKKFRLVGIMFKTANTTNYLHVYIRKLLWKFSAVALGTPSTPTLTARTISGSGLTTTATYKYKITANNILSNSAASAEASINLSGAQNAVSLSWTALTNALDYSIWRTAANGASNSETLLATTDQLTYVDVTPDADLDVTTVPSAGTTSGSVDGDAYATNYASVHTVVDTLGAITTATALDIVYRNVYGERNYVTVTPGKLAGDQVFLVLKGLTNPLDSRRIKKGEATGKSFVYDVGVNDIIGVGNTPATGSFAINGYSHLFFSSSDLANRWNTTYFENTMIFNAGDELAFGVSANTASSTSTRNDVILLGTLE